MSRVLRVFLLFLVFTVEIRIHAFELLELPEGCSNQEVVPCAIRFIGKGEAHFNQSDISLSSAGLLVSETPNRFRFVQGVLFARALEDQAIHTLYADINVEARSEIVLERQGHIFRLYVLKGKADITRISEARPDIIPAGFTVTFGPMTLEGVSISLPEAVDLRGLIAVFAAVRPIGLTSLRSELEGWRDAVVAARELTSQGFLKLAIRQIATAKEIEARRRIFEQRNEAERLRLRELYRARSNLQD